MSVIGSDGILMSVIGSDGILMSLLFGLRAY